jgi:hypothetical protein
MWRLPEPLRAELRIPLGKLISDDSIKDELKEVPLLIVVGDIAALTLYQKGFEPAIAIVDFKTKRQASAELKEKVTKIGNECIRVRNPAGTITDELWDAVERVCARLEGAHSQILEKVRIEIDGEEDLAVLPCIIHAPESARVVYGMPGRGLVVVRVNPQKKEEVRNLLSRFDSDLAEEGRKEV